MHNPKQICRNSDSDSFYWKEFHFFGHMAGLGMRTNFFPYSYILKVEGKYVRIDRRQYKFNFHGLLVRY